MNEPPKRLVFIEDSEDDRRLFELALDQIDHGCEIHMFEGLAVALESMEAWLQNKEFPDLILLDLNLGDTRGTDVLRVLRQRIASPRVPVIMLTTSSSMRDVENCYRAGCDAYFTKPYGVGQLASMLSALLEHWLHPSIIPRPFFLRAAPNHSGAAAD